MCSLTCATRALRSAEESYLEIKMTTTVYDDDVISRSLYITSTNIFLFHTSQALFIRLVSPTSFEQTDLLSLYVEKGG